MNTTILNSNNKLLKTWPQIILFYFIGISLFFITAFVIVTLRISFKREVKVPSLIGRSYLDVHNLLQENGFEVKLKNVHSIHYPYGYIISQSLSPHEVVRFGKKIVLLVNQSKNILKTPLLVGSLDSVVSKILSNVHSGKRRFKLSIGVVTRIPSKRPEGEILAQYPLPSTPVRPNYPISYLVSSGKSSEKLLKKDSKSIKKKASEKNAQKIIHELNIPKKKLNIEIIKSMSHYLKLPLAIELVSVEDMKKDSIVLKSNFSNDFSKSGDLGGLRQGIIWKVQVGVYQDIYSNEKEKYYPFRFIWVEPDKLGVDPGVYTLVQKIQPDETRLKESRSIPSLFSYVHLKKNQPVPLYKTANDQFLIWKGYHENDISEEQKLSASLKEPEEIYQPENITP